MVLVLVLVGGGGGGVVVVAVVVVVGVRLRYENHNYRAAGENPPWSDQTPEGFSCGPRTAVFITQQQERTPCHLAQARP